MSAAAAAARDDTKLGYISAFAAYLLWGGMPIYIHAVGFADPMEILAARILWSLPAAVLAVIAMGGWRKGVADLAAACNPRMLAMLSASSIFIFGNWGIYVWAVAHSHVMEAALAYFISPLATVLIGMFVFNERLRQAQIASIVLAGIGVVVQGVALGAPPWISLLLCASWVSYTVVRKQAPVPAAVGLLIETLILSPIAIAMLVWLARQHPLAFGQETGHDLLLAFSGIVTALPLILFSFGARRLPMSAIGLINYMTPSLQFLVGVAYGEPLTPVRIVSFAFIWLGLLVFTGDSLRAERARRRAVPTAP
jgi:chloramphenicol-sensitive protein RarD